MSDRYQIIASMLDDPKNLAIVLRELHRRRDAVFVSPPIRVIKGPTWAFFHMKIYASTDAPHELSADALAEVGRTRDGKGWEVDLYVDDERPSVLGPFSTDKEAIDEATLFLSQSGYTVLSERPWDRDDMSNYPFPAAIVNPAPRPQDPKRDPEWDAEGDEGDNIPF